MSFNFASAPAPATSSFGATPAPTAPPSTFGGFGGSTSSSFGSPSPAPGGFNFGGTSAPAVAAPTSGFGFGASTPAPAPLFGAGPSAGGSFNFSGAATAPSPFGFPQPAPAPFSNPLSTPAPAPGFGSSTLFGNPPSSWQQSFQQQPVPQVSISGNMQYNDLSPHMKQAFDTMHDSIMKHKRTILNLQSLAPQMLLPADNNNGALSSSGKTPIIGNLHRLQNQLNRLHSDVEVLSARIHLQKEADEKILLQATMYAKWPVEAMAHRKGVRLTTLPGPVLQEDKKDDNVAAEVQNRVRETLDRAMSVVDRIEKMPSPYLWQIIHEMEHRLERLGDQSFRLHTQLKQSSLLEREFQSNQNPVVRVAEIIESQHQACWRLSRRLDQLRSEMELVRYRYRLNERGENVLDKASNEEVFRQRKLDEQIQMQFMLAPPAHISGSSTSSGAPALGTAAVAAPAPAFSLSGLSTTTPSPAAGFSTTGASTSSTPAPASALGGAGLSFSNTTNVATASISTGAPTTASFGLAASTPAAKKKSSTRSSRLRK